MADPAREAVMLHFDRRLMAQFRGSAISSDGGLLTYQEVDKALRLTTISADTPADARSGKNGPASVGRAFATAGIWRACRTRRRERRRAAVPRSGDAVRRRQPSDPGSGCLCQPNGPLSRRNG
jgi:hypothetical protein